MKQFKTAEEIRCAVIGYGGAFNMGKAHLSQMQAAGMVPAAVAEIDEERLKVAEEEFPGIQTFRSVEDMLSEAAPDLVTIITPHNTHAALSLQCLRVGASVVCEKPMAITLEECDEMIDTARENDLLLSVYHNRHWDGCILEAVERIVQQNEIGDIFRIEAHMGGYAQPRDWWRSSRSISGGIHYDWGVHLIEYTLQLVQSDPVEVSAFAHEGFWTTRWGDDTNQDELSAIVRFQNGKLLNLRISQLDNDPPAGQVVVTGTNGTYRMDQRSWEIHQTKEGEKIIRKGSNREGEQHRYYENVAATLTGKEQFVITPEWSRKTMAILTAATQSALENRAVAIS